MFSSILLLSRRPIPSFYTGRGAFYPIFNPFFGSCPERPRSKTRRKSDGKVRPRIPKKTRAPPQKRHVFKRLSVAPILAKYDKPKKETAGFLTYDAAYRAAKGTRAEKRFPRGMPGFIKHSNGGCSGFEPDSLLSKNAQIYSAYNFSNRISSHGIKLNIL